MRVAGIFNKLRKGIGTGRGVRSVSVSQMGLVRKDNQDHFLALDDLCVYVVADGMGGGAEGALASEIVCRYIQEAVAGCEADFAARNDAVRLAIETANDEIFEYSRKHGYNQMGTTVAALVIDPTDGKHGVTMHVGDSRVYRLHGRRLIQLTADHRFGFTNALTRAVGVEPRVEIDVGKVTFVEGDKAFLCTDGVHGFVTDSKVSRIILENTPSKAASCISEAIEAAGARDNYTFIIVR